MRIGAAPAEIPFAAFLDLFQRGIGILLEQAGDAGHKTRRAEAAHHGVFLDKGRLHGAEMVGIAQALGGGDLASDGIDRQRQAAVDGLVVEQHGASAAGAHVADQLWPGDGRLDVIAKGIEERGARLDGNRPVLAVDVERHFDWAGNNARSAGGASGSVGSQHRRLFCDQGSHADDSDAA